MRREVLVRVEETPESPWRLFVGTTHHEQSASRALTAHGTLYKALGRLEEFGLLGSRWEDAAPEGRPRRRLYELTGQGVRVAEQALADHAGQNTGRAPRIASEPA